MVGMALDTNGQKMRYVEAARRWGSDPDVLKALWAGEYDLAGVAGRFADAATKDGPLVIRSAHKAKYAYFQFPTDIDWRRTADAVVRQMAEEADVIHLTNDVKAYVYLRMPKMRKPAVLHHHGTLFRNNPERMLTEARRFRMVNAVSTIDLMKPAPDEVHWLPAAYDMDMLARIRTEHRRPDDGMVRIVSAPTNRAIKSTTDLEASVRTLQAEGLPVELVLVEGRTWQECLETKAGADIYFDQVLLGYGCNAIEAWGMDIPVVAGADEWTLARMRKEWNTRQLPFYEATPETITDSLRKLVKSKNLRATYAGYGKAHADKYHAEKPALTRLAELYALAIETRSVSDEVAPDFRTGPGRFRTTTKHNLQVRIASHTVRFVNGEAMVDNPATAQRLRLRLQHNNREQISEVVDA